MKKAKAESCACRLVSVKIPFTAATSGSISEVMKPQAKNSVVTATNAARTVGLLIRYSPRPRVVALAVNLPSSARRGNRHVVDQPRPADPRGDEQTGLPFAEPSKRLERIRIGQLDVVDTGEPAGQQRSLSPVQHERNGRAGLDRRDRL